MTVERRTKKEVELLAGVELRLMFADYHLDKLLIGSEDKLSAKDLALFKLGYGEGIEYMDIRKPVA